MGKYILRRAAERKLSRKIAFREKKGFSVPIKAWFRQEKYRGDIEAVLFGTRSGKYFDLQLLRRYWQAFSAGNDVLWKLIYAVYVFLLWEADAFRER